MFQVIYNDPLGVRLQGAWVAGTVISLDTKTGYLTFDGELQKLSQYLTAGSLFNIPSGSCDLKILCDSSGTFDYTFYDRTV